MKSTVPALLLKAIRDRNLLVLVLACVTLFTLAYQVDLPAVVHVGDYLDRPYAINFRPPSGKGQDSYRPTRKLSSVVFPGLGSGIPRLLTLEVMGAADPTDFAVEVNGEPVGEFVAPDQWTKIALPLPPAAVSASDLTVTLRTSSPAGVAVRLVEIRTIGPGPDENPAAVRPNALIMPDVSRVLNLALAVIICYLLLVILGVPPRSSLAIAAGALAGLAGLLMFQRIFLTVFDVGLVEVVTCCAALVLLARFLLPAWLGRGGVRLQSNEWTALLLVLFLVLLVKMGGVMYPQFESSDLLYHQHRLERVMAGDVFFLTSSPEFGNLSIPLAPGFYLFLTPLTAVFGDRELMLKLAAVIFEGGSTLLVFYIVRRMTGHSLAGLIGALVYAFTPVTFLLVSAGNIPNLFAQFLLLLLMALVLSNPTGFNRKGNWGLMVLLVASAAITHIGNLIVMLALLGSFILLWLLVPPPQSDRRAILPLLLAVAAGGAISFMLYYSSFAGDLVEEFRGLIIDRFGSGMRVTGTLNFAKVPLAISAAVIAGGIGGTALGWKSFSPILRRAQLAWLASAAVFVGFAQFAGLYVRYNIFVLPALSLGAGVGCVWLIRRSRWSVAPIALFLGYVVWVGISFWAIRVLYTYH